MKPEHVLEGFANCPNGDLLKDALEVIIGDGNTNSYVDCAGTYDYVVRVKKELRVYFFTLRWKMRNVSH